MEIRLQPVNTISGFSSSHFIHFTAVSKTMRDTPPLNNLILLYKLNSIVEFNVYNQPYLRVQIDEFL